MKKTGALMNGTGIIKMIEKGQYNQERGKEITNILYKKIKWKE